MNTPAPEPEAGIAQVAAIARGLTAGQVSCICAAAERKLPWDAGGWEVTGRSANSLSLKGLARGREFRSLTGKSRRGYALTPLGLAVRQHLTRAQGESKQ